MKYILTFLFITFISYNSLLSEWTNLCKSGVSMDEGPHSIAVIDSKVLSGVHIGFIKSVDNGNNFKYNFDFWGARKLVYNKKYLYALEAEYLNISGSFISEDSGETWTEFKLEGEEVHDIVFNGNKNYAVTINGIYYSSDNGMKWILKNTKPNTEYKLKYANDFGVYSLSDSANLMFSKDNGSTWEDLSLPENINLYYYWSVTSDNNLFVITKDKLYKSTDNGLNWTVNQTFLKPYENYIFSSGKHLFIQPREAELLYSSNNGDKWTAVIINDDKWGSAHNISCLGANDEYLFVGADFCIYRIPIAELANLSSVAENNLEFHSEQILLSPNPVTDNLEISFQNHFDNLGNEAIKIFDVLGTEVLSVSRNRLSDKQQINLDKLSAGVYFIKINDKFEKFVKM